MGRLGANRMTEYNSDLFLTSQGIGATGVSSESIPAREFQMAEEGGGSVTRYYRMRGVDSSTAAYTTWTATGTTDPNGVQATGGNTTPALVGTIVAASGVVMTSWQS
jgi:hypothetical protein